MRRPLVSIAMSTASSPAACTPAAQALYRRWAFQDRDRLLMTKQLLAE
jgi:hypothetical protein